MMIALLLALGLVSAQAGEKLLIASIDPAEVDGGVVAELVWEGSELVVLLAVPNGAGHEPRFYALPGPGVALRRLDVPPAGREEYWRRKANRLSPTGLGRITKTSDAQMPMAGLNARHRLDTAAEMGGTRQTFAVRLGTLVLHESAERDPYDGEVWAWSPAEFNRIAYVDGKGDLFVAAADGANPRRVARGSFLLPAWSLDGRAVAVVERNARKKRWDVFVITVPQ